jgi:hypothetical protein
MTTILPTVLASNEKEYPVMGYGYYTIAPVTHQDGTMGLLYAKNNTFRDINSDTSDLFPPNPTLNDMDIVSLVFYKDGDAIEQTIQVLREMQNTINYTPHDYTSNLRHVVFNIVIMINGERVNLVDTTFTIQYAKNITQDQAIIQAMSKYYTDANFEDYKFVMGNTVCIIENVREISKDEFDILSKFIPHSFEGSNTV